MPQPKPPNLLLEALREYEASLRATLPQKKAEATLAQMRTALWRYTLPGWGFPFAQGPRMSPAEYEQGLHFLKQISVERLQDAPEVQERLFEQLELAGNSRRTYRCALHRLIDWCKQQSWWEGEVEANIRRSTSRKRQRKPSANELRLTTRRARQPYRLAQTEQSESLQQELDSFFQYLTEPGPDGQGPKVSATTANQHVSQVLRILGWLYADQGVLLQELSLHRLVEVRTASKGKEPDELPSEVDAEWITGLVEAYLKWLSTPTEENSDGRSAAFQSPYTTIKVIQTWLAVVRFIGRQAQESEEPQAAKAEIAMAALEKLRRRAVAQLKNHQSVSDQSKKRLEWHEFLELVEKLRGECVARFPQRTHSKQGGSTLAPLRSLTAISHSYQRFLLAALLAYVPPQRSQVLRNLVIAQSPLPEPSLQPQELFSQASVVYQDQEAWWIKVVEQKTNHQPTHYLVFVPNLAYADGRCFYQYLEEWLQHYAYPSTQGRVIEVPGLRSCFKPNHDRLFTMKNGQPYENSPAFIKLLRHPAYRIIEKALDFNSVRWMYAEYLKNKEFSGSESEDFGKTSQQVLDSTSVEETYEYNPAAWQKAAAIAQEFLNQTV